MIAKPLLKIFFYVEFFVSVINIFMTEITEE